MDLFSLIKVEESDVTGMGSDESSNDDRTHDGPRGDAGSGKDGEQSAAPSRSSARKKAKYEIKFSEGWLAYPLFSPWLQKRIDGAGKFVPFCGICRTAITMGKSAIMRHRASKAHQRASKMCGNLAKPQPAMQAPVPPSSPSEMEMKMCSFLVENNLPMSLSENLLALLRSLFPANETLNHVTLDGQKATNTIRQMLGFLYMKEGAEQLKGHKFSLVIDEPTDMATESQMAVIGTYFDAESFKMNTVFIDLVDLPNGKADTIYTAVIQCLQEKHLPMENVIGFCANTCSVMFGVQHPVSQLLRKHHPWIVPIKCSGDLIRQCASRASLKLPKSLEDLCRNIHSHFRMCLQKRDAFREFQDFPNADDHRILGAGHTRWLAMKICVDRILEQYEALKAYFQGVAIEDPTHTNDSILTSLTNAFTVAYLEFMSYNLGRLASFNKLFQSEVPLLHVLKHEVSQLLLGLSLDFMELSHVRMCDPLDLNVNDEEHHMPLCNVYTGVKASGTIQSVGDSIGAKHPDITLFQHHCKQFLIECVTEIQHTFSNLQELDFLRCLEPAVANNLTIPSLAPLYQKLPYLEEVASVQDVDTEWRKHSTLPTLNGSLPVQEYWRGVFTQKDACGNQVHPHLSKIISVLLSFPFSNAAVERVFSQLRLIKDDRWTNIKQERLA